MELIDDRPKHERMIEELSYARTRYKKLLIAAFYGAIPLATYLLKKGVSLEPVPGKHLSTPLYRAIIGRDLPMVKFLISNGVKVNQASLPELSNTPLKAAILVQSREIFDYLLEAGADVNKPDEYHGDRPLHEAISFASYDDFELALYFIKSLCSAGADVNIKNYQGRTLVEQLKFTLSCWVSDETEKARRLSILIPLLSGEPVLTQSEKAKDEWSTSYQPYQDSEIQPKYDKREELVAEVNESLSPTTLSKTEPAEKPSISILLSKHSSVFQTPPEILSPSSPAGREGFELIEREETSDHMIQTPPSPTGSEEFELVDLGETSNYSARL